MFNICRSTPDTPGCLDVIAKQLAKLNNKIDDVLEEVREIKEKLSLNDKDIIEEEPTGIPIPCGSLSEINQLEKWLEADEHFTLLVGIISYIKYSKIPYYIMRQVVFYNRFEPNL